MQTKAGMLLFSQRLLAPNALALRGKLISLADCHLDHDIYVDTLLGMHFDPGPQTPGVQGFLIFDFYRIFLYQNSVQPDGPMINSVVRSLVDDYSIAPLKTLADHARDFHFFYPVEILEVLPLLWEHRRAGVLVTLDLSSLEIRTAQAFVHPECNPPRTEDCGADCLVACSGVPSLKDCFTGPGMRSESRPMLDDLVSPNVGVIRRESSVMARLSVPTAIAQMAAGLDTTFSCGGRAANMPAALHAARCEVIERFQVNFLNPQASVVYGSYEMLRDIAIDPDSLCFTLIRPSPSTERAQYDRNLSFYWSSARNPRSGKSWLVPAQEIWFNTHTLPGENLCLMSSTNACALGGSIEEASLFAIFEAIERDAFLTTWYLRRRCRQLVPGSIRLEAFHLLWHRLQNIHPNYSILLFDITTDVAIPVVLVAAVRRSGLGPQVVLSTACRLHTDEAAFAAIKDLSGLMDPAVYDETRARKLLEHPEDVFSPEDHAAFYSLPETLGRLSFLGIDSRPELAVPDLDRSLWFPRQNRYNLKAVVEEMIERMEALEVTVLLKDLTHHEFRQRHLYCVRAIAPDLYPMWFGYYAIRFRMTDRLGRLSEKFLGKPLHDMSEINLDIHPFD
ncbi:MAG TPA: YcaO-like family protein [Candidatus Angelobacter sp.]